MGSLENLFGPVELLWPLVVNCKSFHYSLQRPSKIDRIFLSGYSMSATTLFAATVWYDLKILIGRASRVSSTEGEFLLAFTRRV